MIDATTYKLDDSTDLDTGKLIAKRPPYKLELSILCLLRAANDGINQPEANRAYGETCLNTVVSTLQNSHGIAISRKSEPWQHRHNGNTHFNRYWLGNEAGVLKAVSLLNRLRHKRNMSPVLQGQYFDLPNTTI